MKTISLNSKNKFKKQEAISKDALNTLKRGFDMGKLKTKSRNDLYRGLFKTLYKILGDTGPHLERFIYD